jgi:hypothetical protein
MESLSVTLVANNIAKLGCEANTAKLGCEANTAKLGCERTP